MNNGFLLSFEGTDGVGKSTQIRFLAEELTGKGYSVLVSREPGGSAIGEAIRAILLDERNGAMSPVTELLLYEAARAQHMEEVVLPALSEGKIVILDRFIDSTFAYQGFGRHLDLATLETLNRIAVLGRMPDLTILLALPPEKAFLRKGGRDGHDRMETEGDAFFARVREGYQEAAKRDPARVRTVDVSGTKSETREIISRMVKEWLEKHHG